MSAAGVESGFFRRGRFRRFGRPALALATLLLPLLVLCGMIAEAEWKVRAGTVIRVPIAGYDPRDPLRGHYLTYRIVWNWENAAQPGPDDQALCVLAMGDNPQVRPLARPEPDTDCLLMIRRDLAEPGWFRPVGLSGRLFVDETQAPTLQKALQLGAGRLTVDLSIAANGTARISDWQANGMSLGPPQGPSQTQR